MPMVEVGVKEENEEKKEKEQGRRQRSREIHERRVQYSCKFGHLAANKGTVAHSITEKLKTNRIIFCM